MALENVSAISTAADKTERVVQDQGKFVERLPVALSSIVMASIREVADESANIVERMGGSGAIVQAVRDYGVSRSARVGRNMGKMAAAVRSDRPYDPKDYE